MGKKLEKLVFYGTMGLLGLGTIGLAYNVSQKNFISLSTAGYSTSILGSSYVLSKVTKRDVDRYLRKLENEKDNNN